MSSSSGNLYTSSANATYVERAILMEDIILPELPPFPTHSEVKSGDVYYPRAEELYEDEYGKFSIPIITPLSDNTSDATDTNKTSTVRNIVNSNSCNLTTSSYTSTNYVTLNVPKYILLNYLSKVPKGTNFIVAFIGGSTSTGDIKIIGVADRNE